MKLEDKDCFVIQYNFKNGDPNKVVHENANFTWKGKDWWVVGGHEKKEIVVEREHDVECDADDGGETTMSQICISIPKKGFKP